MRAKDIQTGYYAGYISFVWDHIFNNSMKKTKTIFFHVGMGKTGTTYLQYDVFPHFNNIEYIQRTHYHNYSYVKRVEKSSFSNILISREFDDQMKEECQQIHSKFPDARIIIVFRKHGEWLASQYRRSVKNGYADSFEKYVSLGTENGVFNHQEMLYHDKLVFLERLFQRKPLVLFYDDMRKDPWSFFDKIASYTGASYRKEDINLFPRHKSYSEKQLKRLKKMNRSLAGKKTDYSDHNIIRQIQRLYRMIPRYLILYVTQLLPEKDKSPLVPTELVKKIDEFYKDDWIKCREYALEKVE